MSHATSENAPRIFIEIDGMRLSADLDCVSVFLQHERVVMSLHGKTGECSLANKTDPASSKSALHFGSHGYVHVPNDLADRLVQLGVRDDRNATSRIDVPTS